MEIKRKDVIKYLSNLTTNEAIHLYYEAFHQNTTPKSGWEYDNDSSEYYTITPGGAILKPAAEAQNIYYHAGNLFSDICVAENVRRARNLVNCLHQFAALHNSLAAPNDSQEKLYYIYYSYPDESLNVGIGEYDDYFVIGEPLFKSEEVAQEAINKYADELVWYFTEYNPVMEN